MKRIGSLEEFSDSLALLRRLMERLLSAGFVKRESLHFSSLLVRERLKYEPAGRRADASYDGPAVEIGIVIGDGIITPYLEIGDDAKNVRLDAEEGADGWLLQTAVRRGASRWFDRFDMLVHGSYGGFTDLRSKLGADPDAVVTALIQASLDNAHAVKWASPEGGANA